MLKEENVQKERDNRKRKKFDKNNVRVSREVEVRDKE